MGRRLENASVAPNNAIVVLASQLSVEGQLLFTTVCGPNESSGESYVQLTPSGKYVRSPVITVFS